MNENQNKKCPSCGSEQPENAAFCGECGAKINEAQEKSSDSITPPQRYNSSENQYQQQYQPPIYSQYEMNPQDAPLSLGDYLLMIIAFGVPILGLILMIVWSVSSSANTNRKNFSRAMLIVNVVGFIISVILSIAFAAFFYSLIEEVFRDYGDISNYFYEYGFDMSIFRRFLHL